MRFYTHPRPSFEGIGTALGPPNRGWLRGWKSDCGDMVGSRQRRYGGDLGFILHIFFLFLRFPLSEIEDLSSSLE
jgi:hypothetical protein